ncbi:MAG: hypothetical protein QXY45_02855 [Candidatus Aenigmatarchaeota archaeon]
MPVKWKVVISLFLIFAIIGLLLFSPKGQKITGNKTAPVGSFLKGLTGKVAKSGQSEEKQLDISITGINPQSLGDVQIPINNENFEFKMEYEVISVMDSDISFEERVVEVKMKGVIGSVTFFRNGNMKVEGKCGSIKINGVSISKPSINFLIVGTPIDFEIRDINKDKLIFPSISGSFRSYQLTGGSLMLNNDHLELFGFKGDIIENNGEASISGRVDKIRLNGLDISKS